jgi:hypothetical protein
MTAEARPDATGEYVARLRQRLLCGRVVPRVPW